VAGKDIQAGRAAITVELLRNKLSAGLAAAKKQLSAFAASAASIGNSAKLGVGAVLGAGGMGIAIKAFADAGGALDDISQRTGASVEAISGLGYAAKMSGSSIEDIEKGIRKMQQGIAGGSDALTALGLDPATLSAASPEQQFAMIADKIAQISDPAERVTAAMEIFGKSGANLLPLLSTGSKGIDALRKEAKELGAEMSGEDAAAAAALGDSIDHLGTSFSGLVNTIGATVAPIFTTVLQIMTHGVVQVKNFIAANKGLVIAIVLGAAALGVLGAGFVTAAALAYGLSVAIGVVTSVSAAAGTVMGVLGTILTGGVGVAIAAVVVGLIGLAGYFTYTSGAGGKAMDWLGSKFQMLQDIVGPVFQGIQDAMKGGDFSLAAEILWLGLQVAWTKGTADLRAAWDTWLNGMLGAVDGFLVKFRQRWNDVSGWLADRMLDTYAVFDESFDAEQAKQMRAQDTKRQNESFASGAADRAAGRNATAEANVAEREKKIAELEAALAASTAKAAAVAAEAADSVADVDKSLAEVEAPEPQAGPAQPAQADNALGKASGGDRGTMSGFAAALMGQSGGFDLDAEMLAESKAQSQYLAEIAGAMVGTKQTQVMLAATSNPAAGKPGSVGSEIIAKLDPALVTSLSTANTTLGSILARLKEMEGGFA
jgi:TP901 family phage tail tape measure protein